MPVQQPSQNDPTGVIPPMPFGSSRKGVVPVSQGRRSRFIKVGRLLMSAGLITPAALQEALTIADDLQQQIGRVLTSTQQVSERDLQSALLAQSMLMEGLVEEHTAIEALKLASREGVTFSDALLMFEQFAKESPLAADLEELLLGSGMASPAQIEEAKRLCVENRLPLGRNLMASRGVAFNHLDYTFECLNLINEGRISKQTAIRALADIKQNNRDLSQALKRLRVSPRNTQSKLKLGDLLTAGSIISEKDSLASVEKALMEKRLMGEILVNSGLISAELLQHALNLQSLVVKEVICKEEAAQLLKDVVVDKKSIAEAARARGCFNDDQEVAIPALDLLARTRMIDEEAIKRALDQQRHYQMHPLKALLASEMISANVYRAAIECARLVSRNEMTQPEAVLTLHHCDRAHCEYIKAVRELGLEFKKAEAETQQAFKMPEWSRSPEAKIAGVVIVVGTIAGALAILLNPDFMSGLLVCAIILGIGITFFILGRVWEYRLKEKEYEIKKQEESAKQHLSRLVKIRPKDE